MKTVAALVAAILICAPVAAQESSSESKGREGLLQEITVTAQKRAENLQDVALSMSALSGRSFLAAPSRNVQSPTQLFVLGGTAFGIWTPMAPPYDVNANRNFAGNPLP